MEKTVLITGATKGIGLAASRLLANLGYQIVGIAREALESISYVMYTCDEYVKHSRDTRQFYGFLSHNPNFVIAISTREVFVPRLLEFISTTYA